MSPLEIPRGQAPGNFFAKNSTFFSEPESTSAEEMYEELLNVISGKGDPRHVVTMSSMDAGIENGIKIVHLAGFLLEEKW